jgi:hypothetical protein
MFVRTIRTFLVNLKRHHADLYQALDKQQPDIKRRTTAGLP